MGDLLKDLARTRPSTPDVDPERMERDLARIVALPRRREWTGAPAFQRRVGPALVAAVVVALAIISVPSDREAQLATGPEKWHVLTRLSSLIVVGDAANPYVVQLSSETDKWLAAEGQLTISQLRGTVSPHVQEDVTKWAAAGHPERARQLGGNHDVRIGPLRPAVSKTNYPDFAMSNYSRFRFDALAALPANPVELKKTLEARVAQDNTGQDNPTYRVAVLAMGVMAANVRPDQRRAAFELLKGLGSVRQLDNVKLVTGRKNLAVALPAPPRFQFADLETQLVVNEESLLPIVMRDVITMPQYGLPTGTSVWEEEFLVLETTTADPLLPEGVIVNGEVDSPIIEK